MNTSNKKLPFVHLSIAARMNPHSIFDLVECMEQYVTDLQYINKILCYYRKPDAESGEQSLMGSLMWGFIGDFHYSPANQVVFHFEVSCKSKFRKMTKKEFKIAFREHRINDKNQDAFFASEQNESFYANLRRI